MRGRDRGDGTGGPGHDEERRLAQLLRAEADRHEPDLEAVRRRVEIGLAEPERRPRPAVPGQRRGAAWAAAGFVVATAAGGLAVAGMSDVGVAGGHSGPVRVVPGKHAPGPDRSAASAPASAPAGTPTGSPSPSATPTPVPAASPTATPPSAAVTPPAPVGTRPAPPSRRPVVSPAASGYVVSLSGARDWLVAGARPDGATVRSVAGGQVLGGPHVVGDPRTAVAAGPFRTSWTGGLPDATGSAAGTWLTVHGRAGGPRSGFVVSAPAGATSLTLYVGAGGPDARVTVGDRRRRADRRPAAGPGRARRHDPAGRRRGAAAGARRHPGRRHGRPGSSRTALRARRGVHELHDHRPGCETSVIMQFVNALTCKTR